MGNSIQERQYISSRRYGWYDRRDCVIKIVRLAGQNHRIVDRCHLRSEHCPHCHLRVPERALDPQSLLRKNLAPSFTDEKRDMGPALRETAAEIAAGAAGTEHQDLGFAHDVASLPRPVAAQTALPRLRTASRRGSKVNSTRTPLGSYTTK